MKKFTDSVLVFLFGLIKTLVSTTEQNITAAYNALVGVLGNDKDGNPYTVKKYVDDAISNTATAGAVTIKEISTGLADGILKSFEFYQGGESADKKIGTINLAKDLVVTGGEVVVLADGDVEGKAAGTYIKLTIANQEAPLYINVKDLVEDFTVQQNAPIVQLAVSANREISATIVDGSISTEKLADGAVTEAKLGLSTENLKEGETSISILESRARKAEATAAADATSKANTAEQNAKDYCDAAFAAVEAYTNDEIKALWDQVFNPAPADGQE